MVVRVLHNLPNDGIDAGNVEIITTPITMTLRIMDEDNDLVAEVRFEHIAAYQFADEGHAKGFGEQAINRVVEILDTNWAQSLKAPTMWPWVKRHFAVFLESVGYLEVLAAEVKVSLPV